MKYFVIGLCMIPMITTLTSNMATASNSTEIGQNVCQTDNSLPGGPSVVNPRRYVNWLVDETNKISYILTNDLLDTNSDGNISHKEKSKAIASAAKPDSCDDSEWCAKPDSDTCRACQFAPKNALNLIRDARDKGNKTYEFISTEHYPYGRDGNEQQITNMLSTNPRRLYIVCKATAGEPNNSTTKKPFVILPEAGIQTVRDTLGRVLLRQSQEDFRKDLESASPATLAITDNSLTDQTQYQVEGAAGVDFGWREYGNWSTTGILYAKWERRFTRGDDDEGDVNNLGVGVLNTNHFKFGGWDHKVDLDPLFTTDSEADTSILNGTATWTPSYRVSDTLIVPGGTWSFFKDTALFKPGLNGVIRGGFIADDGGNAELQTENNFLYGGPKVSARLSADPLALLSQFSWETSFAYLFKAFGPQRRIRRLESEVRYTIPFFNNMSVGFKYVDGRNLETFTDEEFVELNLGVKY